MNTHFAKKIGFYSLAGLGLAACTNPGKSSGDYAGNQPNILLFIADDMTWRDCEPYGNSDIKTPNLQRLANEGMCFDNMFTSTAMSAPTRQQLYTGLYPIRNGAFPNHSKVHDGVKSAAHHFKQIGYKVGLIGKQHYGPDEAFPFEYLGCKENDSLYGEVDIKKGKQFIESDNKPFFLVVASNQPHAPWISGNPDGYDKDAVEIPAYMVDCERTRKDLISYYAEITYMDSLFGTYLKYLDDNNLTENTIVIFTSEQGYQFPFGKWTCYDLGLKTAFIVRWPGKVKAGTRNTALTQYVDVIPTLLDAVGENPLKFDCGIADASGKKGFDGLSFLSVLFNENDSHREYVYGVHTTRCIADGSHHYPVRSVRNNKFKYIINFASDSNFYNVDIARKTGMYNTWLNETKNNTEKHEWVKKYKKRPYEELYDLQNDPYEMVNIAVNPKYEDIKLQLHAELKSWMQQQGDKGIETEMQATIRCGWETFKGFSE